MPEALLKRVLAARTFNQGFATVEYTASALVDLDLHLLGDVDDLDIGDFERRSLEQIGMPEAIVMRHRPPHFAHIFSGDGYAAGYYSYLWSEVLDADGFAAFKEAGDIFDPATAKRLKDFVYSAGYLREPAEAYRAFPRPHARPAGADAKARADRGAGGGRLASPSSARGWSSRSSSPMLSRHRTLSRRNSSCRFPCRRPPSRLHADAERALGHHRQGRRALPGQRASTPLS